VVIPGLRDHHPDHWQTHLASKLAKTRTVCIAGLLGRGDLSCARRVEALQITVECIPGPIVFVAHSAGVIALAHWARQYSRAAIVGAVLATPADLETPLPQGYPSFQDLNAHGWLPMPRAKLPFASIVAASSNDPLAPLGRVEGLARAWGSEIAHLGAVGHLNPGSGYGEWADAEALVTRFD
jgi:predicted alpha/beta hydrolase family esterase